MNELSTSKYADSPLWLQERYTASVVDPVFGLFISTFHWHATDERARVAPGYVGEATYCGRGYASSTISACAVAAAKKTEGVLTAAR